MNTDVAANVIVRRYSWIAKHQAWMALNIPPTANVQVGPGFLIELRERYWEESLIGLNNLLSFQLLVALVMKDYRHFSNGLVSSCIMNKNHLKTGSKQTLCSKEKPWSETCNENPTDLKVAVGGILVFAQSEQITCMSLGLCNYSAGEMY